MNGTVPGAFCILLRSCCACSLQSAARSLSRSAARLLSPSCETRLSVAVCCGCMQGCRHQLLDVYSCSVLQLRNQPSSHPAAPHRGIPCLQVRPIPDLVDSVVEDVKLLRKCASRFLFPCLHTTICIWSYWPCTQICCACFCTLCSLTGYPCACMREVGVDTVTDAVLGVMQRTKHRPNAQDLRPALLNRHRLVC
jgi:hypothetical protein